MHLSEVDTLRVLRPPRLGGRYAVARLLGKGAQARVYLAMDARLRQWRAVKLLSPEWATDERIRRRFAREAQAMARMSHPNILRILDIETEHDLPFIVMELARGGAIPAWLERHGPMPPRLAVEAMVQVCGALAHAHMLGVVHRDVKPPNLLIADEGHVVLTDFGIAQVDEDAPLTRAGAQLGTRSFMPPEQRNDPVSVDHRADVYALGATLYTCLTHQFSADLFLAGDRPELLAGVPEPLAAVIRDACRYDREDRIGSVRELEERLLACADDLPRHDGPPLNSWSMPLDDRDFYALPKDRIPELAELLPDDVLEEPQAPLPLDTNVIGDSSTLDEEGPGQAVEPPPIRRHRQGAGLQGPSESPPPRPVAVTAALFTVGLLGMAVVWALVILAMVL